MSSLGKREYDGNGAASSNKRQHRDAREPSIFNVRPMDDITRLISDLISKYCDQDNVEIEAKLGVFVDKQTKQRISFECQSETVIPKHLTRQCRFESNMPLEQHKYYNELLNGLTNKAHDRDFKGERIKYCHTREIDQFYNVYDKKYRVTIDEKTRQVIPGGIVEKIRLENLDIHSPLTPIDFRISVNLELTREQPHGRINFERHKDRISYQHGGLKFDLTQVKEDGLDGALRHELEVEFVNAEQLNEEKRKNDRNEPSEFVPSIERFVNNIRLLAKHAKRMA
ncbi:mRNA triphosphatase CET1 [Hesseltinella vesiculosa]|uniref:mRNA-capping enzyme subunit beta n=1 Tax=Hesseltinella vesiculosa TaxID=101127 RepID=A0A1X2G9Z8_9FUNG|nr:mRNA triphosphatase CET1 [Hesseltinella vesiculosa]